MDHFEDVVPVVFRETSFSFGPSLDAIITKTAPAASSGAVEMAGGNPKGCEQVSVGNTRGPLRPFAETSTPSSPRASDSSAFSLPSARSSIRPGSALPHSPALHSSAPPLGQGCSKDPPPRLVGPARGHFPSPGFSFLRCPVSSGLGCLTQVLSPRSAVLAPAPLPPRGPAAPPPAPRCPRACPQGQSESCLGRRRLEFSVASGYAFFPGRSPSPAAPRSGPH